MMTTPHSTPPDRTHPPLNILEYRRRPRKLCCSSPGALWLTAPTARTPKIGALWLTVHRSDFQNQRSRSTRWNAACDAGNRNFAFFGALWLTAPPAELPKSALSG